MSSWRVARKIWAPGGTFEQHVLQLAMLQLIEVVAKDVYRTLEPENPGLRPAEIIRKSYSEIGVALAARLSIIRASLEPFTPEEWARAFVAQCESEDAQLRQSWQEGWIKQCNGKRLIDDIYRENTIRTGKFNLKRRLAKRMKSEQTEEWTLVRSKLRDALG